MTEHVGKDTARGSQLLEGRAEISSLVQRCCGVSIYRGTDRSSQAYSTNPARNTFYSNRCELERRRAVDPQREGASDRVLLERAALLILCGN